MKIAPADSASVVARRTALVRSIRFPYFMNFSPALHESRQRHLAGMPPESIDPVCFFYNVKALRRISCWAMIARTTLFIRVMRVGSGTEVRLIITATA